MKPRTEQTISDMRRFDAPGGWAVAYSTTNRRLVVTIPKSGLYVYIDVPLEEYQSLLGATNMGAAFATFRKAGYAFEKVQVA